MKNKTSIKHLIRIINFGAKNCPVGRNGLRAVDPLAGTEGGAPVGHVGLLDPADEARHLGVHPGVAGPAALSS